MPARILVVEDNATNLELMTYLLRAFGHTPLPAEDGETGLATAQRERPDLVICDLQLPGLDGYGVARALRGDPALSAVPLVAVTAYAMVGDRDRVLAAGFDGYLAKPIDPQTFVQQIEAFLHPTYRSSRTLPAAPVTPGAATAVPAPPAHGRQRTILVVDDTPANRQFIQSALEPLGYAVVTAQDAAEALDVVRRQVPDLVLSDLHMPGTNGWALLQAIHREPCAAALPVVIISSTGWSSTGPATGQALGAAAFLTYPIDPRQLAGVVESCLARGADRGGTMGHAGGREPVE